MMTDDEQVDGHVFYDGLVVSTLTRIALCRSVIQVERHEYRLAS